MQTASARRNEGLDIAKGLGIIGVVVCHSGGPLTDFTSYFNQVIFFFVSGYLYKDAYTTEPWALVRSRIKTLYIPFVRYGLFFGLLHNVLFKIRVYTDQVESQFNHVAYFDTAREYVLNLVKIAAFAKVEQIVAPLWFLPVLFIVSFLFFLCAHAVHRLHVSKPERWLAMIVAAVFFTGFFFNPGRNLVLRPIGIAMVALAIYYLGYLWKQHEAKVRFTGLNAALCLIVLIAGTPYGPINTGAHQLVSPQFFLGISLAGIYLILFVADQAKRSTLLKSFLIWTGRNTIAIMALHFLAFRLVNLVQVAMHGLPSSLIGKHPLLSNSGGWWLVYSAAGVGLPLLGKFLYEKIVGYLRSRRQPLPV